MGLIHAARAHLSPVVRNSSAKILVVAGLGFSFSQASFKRLIIEDFNAVKDDWELHFLVGKGLKAENIPPTCRLHDVPFTNKNIMSKMPRIIAALLYGIIAIPEGVSVVKKFEVNAVVSPYLSLYLGFPAAVIAKLTRRPVIHKEGEDPVYLVRSRVRKYSFFLVRLLSTGFGEALLRLLDRFIVRNMDFIWAVSTVDYKRVQSYGATNVELIPCGIQYSIFKPYPKSTVKKTMQRFQLKGKVVLYSGRIEDTKGVRHLIEAFKKVLDAGVNATLVFTGAYDPDEKAERYEALVRLLFENHDRIRFMGLLSDDLFPIVMNAADVFVFPSVSHAEGHPRAVYEAMACGRPVVATKTGDLSEFLRDGENGILVPMGNVDALAKAIVHLLLYPEDAKKMGRKARRLMLKRIKSVVEVSESVAKHILEVAKVRKN